MQRSVFTHARARLAAAGENTGSEPEPRLAQFRHAPSIETRICGFLTTHPSSSALLVAQHVWGELRETGRDLHVDSWLWIRERIEALAAQGILQPQQRGPVQVWSMAEPELAVAA